MKIESSFNSEKKLISRGYKLVIGIDEAGRGPLAGPVVAAATTLKNKNFLNSGTDLKLTKFIRDSKTLSEKQRESLYDFIWENFYVGVGICDHKTVDRINILEATYLAMKKAVTSLSHSMEHKTWNSKKIILVDGNKTIPNLSIEQHAVINGDKIVKSISAASIIAKVTRDRMMIKKHEIYPNYGFNKHKGYGTALHLKKLKKHGPCKIHRRSFNPVKQLIRRDI
jgi:ribonuclease HII